MAKDRKEYYKQYYAKNREKALERNKEYYAANREKMLEQMKEWRMANREYYKEYMKEYYNTPIGRATRLLAAYNVNDKKYNRGEGNLTPEWIVDNIFSQSCAHCGKSGWEIIGCNRLNNDLPHTKDNVEPCCCECNKRLAIEDEAPFKDKKKQVFQYSLDGQLVRVWESTAEAGRNGFNQGAVSNCCNGKLNKYKGYKWSFNPYSP